MIETEPSSSIETVDILREPTKPEVIPVNEIDMKHLAATGHVIRLCGDLENI